MKQNAKLLQSKMQACLTGVQIGDALGMPVESMTAEQILTATCGAGIQTFCRPIQTRIPDIQNLNAGDTTDDWQLTAAVARSVQYADKFDLEHCLRHHVIALKGSKIGWGRTTRCAIKELADFWENDGKKGRSWDVAAPAPKKNGGCGNGVAMKIAPLALFHAVKHPNQYPETLLQDVMKLGLATHGDPRASFCAYALAVLIGDVLHDSILYPRHAKRTWKLYGRMYEQENRLYLQKIIRHTRKAEQIYKGFRSHPDTVSGRLQKILDQDLLNAPSATCIAKKTGSGCYALESVPFSIATFLRNPKNFKACMLETVNAGGDTDTNAAMVGALLGANLGMQAIPEEWREFQKTNKETSFQTPAFKCGIEFADAMFYALTDFP